ncbi:MAG: hypothetical protein ONB24_14200, partial [candidate division KSB1 bacterium]|nr:hypothetical protein [candidate division KSB1 bacterium]
MRAGLRYLKNFRERCIERIKRGWKGKFVVYQIFVNAKIKEKNHIVRKYKSPSATLIHDILNFISPLTNEVNNFMNNCCT